MVFSTLRLGASKKESSTLDVLEGLGRRVGELAGEESESEASAQEERGWDIIRVTAGGEKRRGS